jgi:hypothetical protein
MNQTCSDCSAHLGSPDERRDESESFEQETVAATSIYKKRADSATIWRHSSKEGRILHTR